MILIVGGAPWDAAQRGVEVPESGFNVRRFDVRYFPEINERLPDNVGETIARGVSDDYSTDVTAEGETLGAISYPLGSAISFANDTDELGGGGQILMDECTISQERAGWRSVNIRASSNPQL